MLRSASTETKMRLRAICTSKIHHATVTEANVAYIGSIGIDAALIELADIRPGEKVGVWNVNSGARIETYAIPAPQGSGEIVVNGSAARHFQVGDKVIIVAFALTDEAVEPRMFLVGERNEFAGWLKISSDPQAVQEELSAPATEV
jgi:aspartate 1-decarboxylase